MAIDYERLRNWLIPEVEQVYGAKDTILYALGLGFGADPTDRAQLRFVYEKELQALPTMALVLGYPGFWLGHPETGVNVTQVVHGEQSIRVHAPLEAAGTVIGRSVVEDILDKGVGRGALLYTRRDLFDKSTGRHLATLRSTTFARADGGFGGPSGPAKAVHVLPQRAPDWTCDLPTLPQSALIYRLSGDLNPLHADPEIASAAGFPRPILHGLATFGVAGHALLRTVAGYDPSRLIAMEGRFSAPVYPGETLRTDVWREGEGRFGFRCRVPDRDSVVLDHGLAELRA